MDKAAEPTVEQIAWLEAMPAEPPEDWFDEQPLVMVEFVETHTGLLSEPQQASFRQHQEKRKAELAPVFEQLRGQARMPAVESAASRLLGFAGPKSKAMEALDQQVTRVRRVSGAEAMTDIGKWQREEREQVERARQAEIDRQEQMVGALGRIRDVLEEQEKAGRRTERLEVAVLSVALLTLDVTVALGMLTTHVSGTSTVVVTTAMFAMSCLVVWIFAHRPRGESRASLP